MRFIIRIGSKNTTGWPVSVLAVSSAPRDICPREMQWREHDGKLFPLPPTDELKDCHASLHELCRDVSGIARISNNIITGDLEEHDVERFGQYLFACLIGKKAWAAIDAVAPPGPIELALDLDGSDAELNRLPWEMMHSPTAFLAAEPQRLVAISRLVTHTTRPAPLPTQIKIQAPLKVLFVIGSSLDDRAIQAGAEYMGLLQWLEAHELLDLHSHVILPPDVKNPKTISYPNGRKSPASLRSLSQQLEDEMARFRPSIVHFICHGDDQGRLNITSNQGPAYYDAAQLLSLLGNNQRELIVVLNACYSSSAPIGQPRSMAPFAARLIQEGGLPIVVGMTGRVSDRACRLFTRRFYQALLAGESVVEATAMGRRAGFAHGANPKQNMDWASPTIYLREDVSPKVIVEGRDESMRIVYIAHEYQAVTRPLFYDRFEQMNAYRELINGPALAHRRALAVEESDKSHHDPAARYGKTRLLQELAAKIVYDRYIVCFVKQGRTEEIRTASHIGMQFRKAMKTTCKLFQLGCPTPFEISKVLQKKNQPAAEVDFDPIVDEEHVFYPLESNEVIGAALRLDFARLVSLARETYVGQDDIKLLLLIDDIHRFDSPARDFLVYELLGLGGTSQLDPDVYAIFTYSSILTEHQEAAKQLNDLLQQGLWSTKHTTLERFKREEEPLIYRQLLLNLDPPKVIREPGKDKDRLTRVTKFNTRMGEIIQGIPSYLLSKKDDLKQAIDSYADILEDAKDEDFLNPPGGNGPLQQNEYGG